MNMANYIKFIEAVRGVRFCKENNIELRVRSDVDTKKKPEFYMTNDLLSLENSIGSAKIFEIPEDVRKSLLLTDPPKNPDMLRLPFPSVFLDVNISKMEGNLDENTDIVYGILIVERKVLDESTGKEEGRVFTTVIRDDEDGYAYLDENIFNIDSKGLRFQYKHRPKTAIALQKFIYNFVLFLNQPEVKIIESVPRTREQQEKRIREGKIPLPASKIVTVTGVLKKYLDSLVSGGHFSYSHKFWVRGHWRHLRSERYGRKVGTMLWILPYVKGQGVLIEKTYKAVLNPNIEYEKFKEAGR